MHLDAEPIGRPETGTTTATPPWLLVVARGHSRLVAELQAIFREYPQVQVIENRRHGHVLLPRGESILGPTS